jgi:hypothetical protein
MQEPMLRAWIQESAEPRAFHAERPGRWVAEPTWPASDAGSSRFVLNAPGSLDATALSERRLEFRGAQQCGLYSGSRTAFGRPGDFSPDQRVDDGLSLCFTSAPLDDRLELLGYPTITLALSVDRPLALICVRLCDVSPDGSSSLLSRGLLNLAHRHSREQPAPLVPGQRETVTLTMDVLGCALPAGHRLRIAISPTYWPFAWPSPEPVTLSVFTGFASFLTLPVRLPRSIDAELPEFEPVETAPPLEVEVLSPSSGSRTMSHELASGMIEETLVADDGQWRQMGNRLEYGSLTTTRFCIQESDPLSASTHCARTFLIGRGDWQTRVDVSSELRCDHESFHLISECSAYAGDEQVFSRTWTFDVPRDHV